MFINSMWSKVKGNFFVKHNGKVADEIITNDDSDEYFKHSLHLLAKNGDADNAQIFLERYKNQCNQFNKHSTNAFEVLAGAIEKTIQHKRQQSYFETKINAKDEENLTALHYAAKYNQLLMVKLLLDYGADANITNEDGLTPLHFVAKSRRFNANEETGVDVSSNDNVSNNYAKQISQIITCLMLHNANVNEQDIEGMTPLHYASMRGNTVVAAALMEQSDLNIDVVNSKHQTPLHVASFYGHHRLCYLLLRRGADPTALDDRGCNALHAAASEGRLEVVELLLKFSESKTDPEKLKFPVNQLIDQRNCDQATPLLLAVEHGKVDVVAMLLKYGADVNAKTVSNDGVLHLACQSRSVDVLLKVLLESGAEVDCRNNNYETPLHMACSKSRVDTVETFLAEGSNLEAKRGDGSTPLLVACSSTGDSPENVKITMALLINKADALVCDSYERTALFLACRADNLGAVKVLLKDGRCKTLVSQADKSGNTPLHVAAGSGNTRIVKLLLNNGAEPRAKNEEEQTPLHLAALKNRAKVAALLVDFDRKCIFSRDTEGDTPLHCACNDGRDQAAQYLLKRGAPLNCRNSHQKTPLDCAAEKGNFKTVEILLDNGASVEMSDQSNTTALHLAAKRGHADIVNLLLNRGTAVDVLDSKGRNCLDLAIDYDHADVAMVIVKNSNWKKALRHCRRDVTYYGRCTPMRQLILKLPDVAREVFNQCIVTNGKVRDHPSYEIQFDYEFIDDTYCSWPNLNVKKSDESVSDVVRGFDSDGRMLRSAEAYSTNSAEIRINHPLMIMVLSERQELLGHPLATSLLNHKWFSYGRYVYYFGLILYLLFVLFLTNYITSIDAPFYFKTYTNSVDECFTVRLFNSTGEGNYLFGSGNNKQWASRFFMIIMIIINLCKEIFQMFTRRLRYFALGNLIELATYVTTILLVADFDHCNRSVGVRSSWQWQVGTVAVFLAWINLVLYVRKFPHLGIYVVMLWDVLRTFARFFVVFFLLIVSFATAFYALFKNQPAFSSLPKSITKTLVMMVGEYDYVNLFYNQQDTFYTRLYYPDLATIFFSLFVIIMTILIMNLLVGLAVDDIKSVQGSAVLKRYAMQVELVLETEQVIPEFLRRRWMIIKQSKRPNELTTFEIFLQRHWLSSKSLRAMAEPLYEIKSSKLEEDVEELKIKHESLTKQLSLLHHTVEKLGSQQSRMLSLMQHLAQHLNLSPNDNDTDSDNTSRTL